MNGTGIKNNTFQPGTNYMSLRDQSIVEISPISPQPITREELREKLNQFSKERSNCAHALMFTAGALTFAAGIIAQLTGVPCHYTSPIICVGGTVTGTYVAAACCSWWCSFEARD